LITSKLFLDITPISLYEKCISIGISIIGVGMFAFAVNTIGNIF